MTMTRDEFLTLVKINPTARHGSPLFEGVVLPKDLSNISLHGVDLRGAKLRGADLWGAKLENTNFSGADLSGVDLRNANLEGANFYNVDLTGAIFDYPLGMSNDNRLVATKWNEDWFFIGCWASGIGLQGGTLGQATERIMIQKTGAARVMYLSHLLAIALANPATMAKIHIVLDALNQAYKSIGNS